MGTQSHSGREVERLHWRDLCTEFQATWRAGILSKAWAESRSGSQIHTRPTTNIPRQTGIPPHPNTPALVYPPDRRLEDPSSEPSLGLDHRGIPEGQPTEPLPVGLRIQMGADQHRHRFRRWLVRERLDEMMPPEGLEQMQRPR